MAFELITTNGKRISLLNDKEADSDETGPRPIKHITVSKDQAPRVTATVMTPVSPPLQGSTMTNAGTVRATAVAQVSPSHSTASPVSGAGSVSAPSQSESQSQHPHSSMHPTPVMNQPHYSYQQPQMVHPTYLVSPGVSYDNAAAASAAYGGPHYPIIYYNAAPKDPSPAAHTVHTIPGTVHNGVHNGVPAGVPNGMHAALPTPVHNGITATHGPHVPANSYYHHYQAQPDQNVLPPPPPPPSSLPMPNQNGSNGQVYFSNHYPYSFVQQQAASFNKNAVRTSPPASTSPRQHVDAKFSAASSEQMSAARSPVTSVKPVKRYTCHCMRSFTTSGHLARHMRIHTGEKNYNCPYEGCGAKFSRQDNCMQHYRTHMGGRGRVTRKRGGNASYKGTDSSPNGSNDGASAKDASSRSSVDSTRSPRSPSPSAFPSTTPTSQDRSSTQSSTSSAASVSRSFAPLGTTVLPGTAAVISA